MNAEIQLPEHLFVSGVVILDFCYFSFCYDLLFAMKIFIPVIGFAPPLLFPFSDAKRIKTCIPPL